MHGKNASTWICYSLSEHYLKFLHKQPCMDSAHTGNMWLMEILRENESRYLNLFRMNATKFLNPCNDLQMLYGLLFNNWHSYQRLCY